jgi:hypothetical protein
MPLLMTTQLSTASRTHRRVRRERTNQQVRRGLARVGCGRVGDEPTSVRTLGYSANHVAPRTPLALRLAPLEAPRG